MKIDLEKSFEGVSCLCCEKEENMKILLLRPRIACLKKEEEKSNNKHTTIWHF